MFGLLGNLTDEQRYGLMMAAARAMQPGPGGNAGAFGRALEGGLLGYQGAMGLKDRRAEEAQQREARQMEMEHRRTLAEREKRIGQLAQSAFAPPQTTQPDPYEFDQMGQGSPTPAPFTRMLAPAAHGGIRT